MKIMVSGGAGFIGSHLSESLSTNNEVIVVDNFSSGSRNNLSNVKNHNTLKIIEEDCTNLDSMRSLCKGIETVYHFAANPEVRMQKDNDTYLSFSQNVIATRTMLEVARICSVKKFIFASTSTIYGEPSLIPTPENYGPLKPISIYGATKLASEALVSAYCRSFKMNGIILRFANIIGQRSKHGVIFDFYNKLVKNDKTLEILGDGKQKKSYLHINDCIKAILIASKEDGLRIFNIGSEDQIDVISIAKIIASLMEKDPKFSYTGGVDGGRGWIGDVKNMLLDTTKIKKLGFKLKLNSEESVKKTISDILE